MRVLIHGDSWGCGAWNNQNTNNHPGIELFLTMQGHTVENYSIRGNHNINVYNTLVNKNLKNYDFIFVFFTNPFRDFYIKPYTNVPDRSITYEKYLEIYKELTIKFYDLVDSLNKPIYLLGGHNKVDAELLNHKNIINFIPSIREMFYPDFKEEQVIYMSGIFRNHVSKFTIDCTEKLHNSMIYMTNLKNKQKEYFYPDGYHLNVKGHKLLAQYLHKFMLDSNLG